MGEPADLTIQTQRGHIPVLLNEVLEGLVIKPGGCYLDATVGGGGHSAAILEASAPDGRVLGLDRDPSAAERAAQQLRTYEDRSQVVHASYVRLEEVIAEIGFPSLDGALFDLGFSSWQVDDPERGFAFRTDGPLDMRFDPTEDTPTAAEVVNQWPETELADLIYRYGEEKRSRRIAQALIAARPIQSTAHLADVILTAIGRSRKARIHPATQTFQALRIAVNRELEAVKEALPQAIAALVPGGRLAVITFHSLEDRIVKQFFRQEARGCICPPSSPICTCEHEPTVKILTRKPIVPTAEETTINPRSRSAKLRIAEKT